MASGREFELGIIACLVRNPQYLRHYGDILLERHFADPVIPKYLRILKASYKKHGQLPTLPEFKMLLQMVGSAEEAPSEIVSKMFKDAKKVYTMEVSDVTRDHVEEFITERVLQQVEEAIPKADMKKRLVFLQEVQEKLSALARMGSNYEKKGTYLLDEDVIRETYRSIQNVSTVGYRTTGIPRLDNLIGGFGPGEFSVYAGATGRGKTSSLIMTGAANILDGQRVLHISLDEPELQCRQRYLTNLTAVPKRALISEDEYVSKLKHLIGPKSRNLIIWSEPNETISTLDILDYVKRKEEELYYYDITNGLRPPETAGKIDIVIVDYATKTKRWMSKNKNDQGWDTIRYCSEEHQHLARTLNIPILSGLQGNKEMALQEIGQLTSIAQGYAANQALTNCLIICQLEEDLHLNPSPMWLYGAKTRDENSLFLVPILYSKATQRTWDDPDREVDYVSSTISKRAKPKNYCSVEQQKLRRENAAPVSVENKDYQRPDESSDTPRYSDPEVAREAWRQRTRGAAALLEEE